MWGIFSASGMCCSRLSGLLATDEVGKLSELVIIQLTKVHGAPLSGEDRLTGLVLQTASPVSLGS